MSNEGQIGKVRRVVTGHDETGKAVFLFDGKAANVQRPPRGGVVSTLFWVTDETPASLASADNADRAIGIPPPINGSIFRVVEYAPDATVQAMPKDQRDWAIAEAGAESGGEAIQTAASARHHGMHRTKSVDYAIVLSGEIWLMLDESETLLRAGDVVVQQATWHAWSNRGSEPCRIAFVLIGAVTPWE